MSPRSAIPHALALLTLILTGCGAATTTPHRVMDEDLEPLRERFNQQADHPHIDGIQHPAWDVWMLFAPGLRWDGRQPPAPSHWEHQLSSLRHLPERRLDPERFAAMARDLAPATRR